MKDTNRILILYKYDIYNHYTSKGIYRLLDTNLPYFDMHLNWFIQILYNTYNSNIKSYYYMIFENKFFNELIKIKLEKVFFCFQKFYAY